MDRLSENKTSKEEKSKMKVQIRVLVGTHWNLFELIGTYWNSLEHIGPQFNLSELNSTYRNLMELRTCIKLLEI